MRSVDFPAFVGGLVDNVFRSIVETSIEQMRAYAELMAAVAKSAEEYMAETIGVGQGRHYMVDRFPDLLALDLDSDGESRLRVTAEDSEGALVNAPVSSRAFARVAGAPGLERAVGEAERLLLGADAHAETLPPAGHASEDQMRGVVGLYLASTLEAAGLIGAIDDLVSLLRFGALPGPLGDAGPLVADFWERRDDRITADERLALFARQFGAPAGPVDTLHGVNEGFEEGLLDLRGAIIDAADGSIQGQVRAAGRDDRLTTGRHQRDCGRSRREWRLGVLIGRGGEWCARDRGGRAGARHGSIEGGVQLAEVIPPGRSTRRLPRM